MQTKELPKIGEYIQLEFDKENGGGTGTVQGEVVEVDEDPNPPADLEIRVDEGTPNQVVVYSTGTYQGESYAWVERISETQTDVKLGENGSWEKLTP
jgi:hypothetical protein